MIREHCPDWHTSRMKEERMNLTKTSLDGLRINEAALAVAVVTRKATAAVALEEAAESE